MFIKYIARVKCPEAAPYHPVGRVLRTAATREELEDAGVADGTFGIVEMALTPDDLAKVPEKTLVIDHVAKNVIPAPKTLLDRKAKDDLNKALRPYLEEIAQKQAVENAEIAASRDTVRQLIQDAIDEGHPLVPPEYLGTVVPTSESTPIVPDGRGL